MNKVGIPCHSRQYIVSLWRVVSCRVLSMCCNYCQPISCRILPLTACTIILKFVLFAHFYLWPPVYPFAFAAIQDGCFPLLTSKRYITDYQSATLQFYDSVSPVPARLNTVSLFHYFPSSSFSLSLSHPCYISYLIQYEFHASVHINFSFYPLLLFFFLMPYF